MRHEDRFCLESGSFFRRQAIFSLSGQYDFNFAEGFTPEIAIDPVQDIVSQEVEFLHDYGIIGADEESSSFGAQGGCHG